MKRGALSVAVIGCGLAGGLLASRLAKWANVTVFERGPRALALPPRPLSFGHPLGLEHTFAYGVGGTTNLWRGCLVQMKSGEFTNDWPAEVRDATLAYSDQVVELLYGSHLACEWRRRRASANTKQSPLDQVLAPNRPFNTARMIADELTVVSDESVDAIEELNQGVLVRTSRGAGRYQFDAVVVACGAVNSPALLKNSGLGGEQAGQNLTDHPMGMVAKVAFHGRAAKPSGMFAEGEWKNVAKFEDTKTGLWTSFQLCPTHDLSFDEDHYLLNADGPFGRTRRWRRLLRPQHAWAAAGRVSSALRPDRFALVLAMTEQEARGQGQITLAVDGGLELHWQISDEVIGAVGRSLDRFAQWLDADLHLPPGELRSVLWSGAHHAGTCRLSTDEQAGVIDQNLQIHGTSRIFVCDASSLPSTGTSNPGLAIGAIAVRLADHLCLHANSRSVDEPSFRLPQLSSPR